VGGESEMHLGNLLQSEGGVAVAGPVQIVPVQSGAAQSPGPSAPPAASRPAQGPAAAATTATAVLALGGVTSRGHVAAAAAGTEASRAARRAAAAAAAAADSWRDWAVGSRGHCWPRAARVRALVDRPAAAASPAAAAAAASAHTAAAAAAAAAAGDSDPASSIATLRRGPEVSAVTAAHIQFAGGREPARGAASLSFRRFPGARRGPQVPLTRPPPRSDPFTAESASKSPPLPPAALAAWAPPGSPERSPPPRGPKVPSGSQRCRAGTATAVAAPVAGGGGS
jgi:hypothetical protein